MTTNPPALGATPPIESDDEFIALMRERFASKPYSRLGVGSEQYWNDARYETFIQELLVTQQTIRRAAETPAQAFMAATPDVCDRLTAEWAIWSIATPSHDVGATPTHWHRVWDVISSVIASIRADERERIAAALRADNASMIGPTAQRLIESDIAKTIDCDD